MTTKKTATPLSLEQELDLLRKEDEARAQRVRRIEILQLPQLEAVAALLASGPILEILPKLEEALPSLTDQRGNAVANLIAHAQYLTQVLTSERERLGAMAAEDAAKASGSAI